MDLLSVHIPKAAGNAVRRLLVRPFGAGVGFLYDDFRDAVDYDERLDRFRAHGAVHGHVPLDLLRSRFPDARTMVWFRHPVDRIVSYAWFWKHQPRHGNPNHDRFLDAGADPVWLAELLRDEVRGYLGRTPVEDLDFVGVVENFDRDAARFEHWLADQGLPRRAWRGPRDRWARTMQRAEAYLAPVANRNRKKGTLEPDVLARIETTAAQEMAIYQRALARSGVSSRAGRWRS